MSCVSIISPLTIVGAMVKPYLLEFDVMHFHRVAMMIYHFTSNYLFACLLFTLRQRFKLCTSFTNFFSMTMT